MTNFVERRMCKVEKIENIGSWENSENLCEKLMKILVKIRRIDKNFNENKEN